VARAQTAQQQRLLTVAQRGFDEGNTGHGGIVRAPLWAPRCARMGGAYVPGEKPSGS
jgi:hypothetical protein